ncbi:unnamed protein product [Diamesa serratosioi]
MNKFLKEAKALVSSNVPLLAVLGNESCDLDSALSAIGLAFHYHEIKNKSVSLPDNINVLNIVPVLNVNRIEVPLKTEVVHWLKKNDIEVKNLICKDEINKFEDVKHFVLVDHHVSPFHESVVSVLDHRPFDSDSNLGLDCKIQLKEVGSCCTLVIDLIKKDVNLNDMKEEYSEVLKLLYAAIVLDTINFSKEADRYRALDVDIVENIEQYLNIENVEEHRKKLFNELVEARSDISTLNSLQILSKDLKIISNKDNSVRVALSAVLLPEYTDLANATENLKRFVEKNDIDVICLMSMKTENGTVTRDFGIVDIKNKQLFDNIQLAVENHQTPNLGLTRTNISFLDGIFYNQSNVKASRKQILPVIKEILKKY